MESRFDAARRPAYYIGRRPSRAEDRAKAACDDICTIWGWAVLESGGNFAFFLGGSPIEFSSGTWFKSRTELVRACCLEALGYSCQEEYELLKAVSAQ